jgi:hypothetical protein
MRVWVLVGWLHWEYESRDGPGLCVGGTEEEAVGEQSKTANHKVRP